MKTLLLALALTLSSTLAFANAKIGAPAPDFTAVDAEGKTHKLADYKGKYVVLEWYNKDCPYVRKHYGSQNMQKTQTTLKEKGVVWLSVQSSAPGKEGYLTAADTIKNAAKEKSNADAILMDEKGVLGKAYGAKTTPHIFLIDPQGVLRYNGAIDDNDSADPKTIYGANNYIIAAVVSAQKGAKIAKETTKPYGCSVKY
jgi:peroxiredoxin